MHWNEQTLERSLSTNWRPKFLTSLLLILTYTTDQDLNRILFHFIHGPSKPVNDKPLPTPEERQAMDDAAAMRGVKEEVKEYEQKQKKAGKKLQAAEPRWGWAGPKHPRDPKADKIDLLG
ncbi:hypothetical protein Pmar_PMAR020840 [Perkinsus marinus ATCC 50983]|uniref:Uncharacterized protein n=1 Tax=Perkinsus marinus (strain ATCC 50983 / TXsc) TaxID=423536 RepID=C5KEA8_PERM5|nr:hypothetical protein Pmar_PMAR020840 [Perkinsus marinus ATCC 50983]EER17182.1 hypothetical protein Pmar_PMAR020840 [Perkinsus marinus ATCC 50983]|eukprot:XP_002785386.1 hypothetical protein Pmar_PMAR020840 [Perkinsus marinus ATCC 50983]